uniref:Helicase C-terminal domain-containing protein n=1 Tax=Glossina morsitans morsitans TaxID=37546 RepID=A0A1B0FL61_GLOMM
MMHNENKPQEFNDVKRLPAEHYKSPLTSATVDLNAKTIKITETDIAGRERLVTDFNLNTNVTFFITSIKTGSLGINLVNANHIIIYDASWDPCDDTQAVYPHYQSLP